ncbi:outer membrane beta-barrel protein [Aquimarina mytili]|uniref:Outer membrane beta-barrel protein n=1 Tax=Aquimarina mytili TaxID=874423 RepID=A0A936ZRY9_9FLAO|nr:outer membrane beta-barrel protein [Aquimarina mytili]MBL0684539.1 outer membrane beta-barrel protein [Aquimarina mytili]
MAQENLSNEVNIGYGLGTSTTAINAFGAALFSGDDNVNTNSSGAFYISYKIAVSKRFRLGALFIREKVESEEIERPENTISEQITVRANTFALEFDYRYVFKEKLQLYSGIGVGYTFGEQDLIRKPGVGQRSESENVNHFNCQFNFFGIRYGKSFGIFAEFGYGYKGIFNAGVSFQF